MATGWRRAFCTSLPREDDDSKYFPWQTKGNCRASHSPRLLSSGFGFFSNPSTPRVPSQSPSPANLRCPTADTTAAASAPPTTTTTPTSSVPGSPKSVLSHKTPKNSTAPSSPKSPSGFSLLKSTLRLSKTRCGICLQSVKTGQGTAIFTAECFHVFHFPCIASQFQNNRVLVCPVCAATWRDLPLLLSPSPSPRSTIVNKVNKPKKHDTSVRVYDDDESLLSPTLASRFIPILESDEENEEDDVQSRGFVVAGRAGIKCGQDRGSDQIVEVSLMPEAAVVSMNKAYSTYAVVLRVKVLPAEATPRASVDLVAVLDVGTGMSGEKLRSMKRAMHMLISSLGESDRMSIVAFSSTSKRLLPLKRMTVARKRSVMRIVDAIGCTGQSAVVNDALWKAAKVLEDRREKNTSAMIMFLWDGNDQRTHTSTSKHKRLPSSSLVVSSTRIGDIPVHTIGFCETGTSSHVTRNDEEFRSCLGRLLSVAVQDLKLQLGFFSGSDPGVIAGVYSLMGRPAALGSGVVLVGDLFPEEERELLVEVKGPSFYSGAHHVISVGLSYREPSTCQLVHSREVPLLVPKPQPTAVGSTPVPNSIQRLKNLHVTARAIAESRRLVDSNRDLSGAHHLLSSAWALVARSGPRARGELLRCLEVELGELRRMREGMSRSERGVVGDKRAEMPTPMPTSAWKAAERLAKVAVMRKSMNRVSDLHGLENARF